MMTDDGSSITRIFRESASVRVFRGLRGLTTNELAQVGVVSTKKTGAMSLGRPRIDRTGYWSTRASIALTYATTAAVTERSGTLMVVMIGTTTATPRGKIGAVEPGSIVTVTDVIWSDDVDELTRLVDGYDA